MVCSSLNDIGKLGKAQQLNEERAQLAPRSIGNLSRPICPGGLGAIVSAAAAGADQFFSCRVGGHTEKRGRGAARCAGRLVLRPETMYSLPPR